MKLKKQEKPERKSEDSQLFCAEIKIDLALFKDRHYMWLVSTLNAEFEVIRTAAMKELKRLQTG